MPETRQRCCPFGRIRSSVAGGEYRRREAVIIELELAREHLLDERGLLSSALIGGRGPRRVQRGVVAGHRWRVLWDERLHALNGEPVRGPTDARREHEFLLAENAFKVDFLVLDKIYGANGCELGEGSRATEDQSRVWAVAIERLNVDDAQGAINVTRGEGCTPRMAHEARCLLESGERERQA